MQQHLNLHIAEVKMLLLKTQVKTGYRHRDRQLSVEVVDEGHTLANSLSDEKTAQHGVRLVENAKKRIILQ